MPHDERLATAIDHLVTALDAIRITSRHTPSESEARTVRLDLSLQSLEARVAKWAEQTGRAYDLLGYPCHENVEKAYRVLSALQTEMAERSETDSVKFVDYPKLTDEEIDKRIEASLSLWKWRLSRDSYHPRTEAGLLAHEALCLRDKVKDLLNSLKLSEGRIDELLDELKATRDKLVLPHSASRAAPDGCERQFVTDANEPPYLRIVSSIRTKTAGAHERVFIWIRGVLSGELTMYREDVEVLCSVLGLRPKDAPK
jgi:hypothetical protein